MSVELPRDAEGREIPLDTVALCFSATTMHFAGWTAAGPMRGKDLPTSLTARARISSVLGELVSGA